MANLYSYGFKPAESKISDKDIRNKIVNLIVKDLHPISIIDDEGFNELMKFAFPNYTLPCRATITSEIEKKYNNTKQNIHQQYGINRN